MIPSRVLLVEQNQDGTIGGSHHSLLLLVQNLDRARYEPVVAFYEDNKLVSEFRKHATVVMLPVAAPLRFGRTWSAGGPLGRGIALGIQKAGNLARARWSDLARIVAVAGRIKPQVIHLNNSVHAAGLDWMIASRLGGAKLITHQRGYGSPSRWARSLDRIICISRSVQTDLIAQDPALADRIEQIYNGISVDDYVDSARSKDPSEVRREFGVLPGEVLIGLIGNIQTWKGQDVLLRALPLLAANTRWRCVLVGAIPTDEMNLTYHQQLKALVRDFHLEDRVVLSGYRADVAAIVNAVDVLVHTSVQPEPMGRVILEGMALGKTVVATDHGGPQEIIEPGRSGFLVPPGDPEALAKCLDQVLADPDRRQQIGVAAAARVRASFSTTEYARRVQEVYSTLLAEPAGSSK